MRVCVGGAFCVLACVEEESARHFQNFFHDVGATEPPAPVER